jgi:hypothetical protein
MMPLFELHFHPVGQGLFSSGSLFNRANGTPVFHWIYDCGTDSDQAFIQQRVEEFASGRYPPRSNNIDLFFISHFDEDHIKGLPYLSSTQTIDRLVLPYMTLPQRLVQAFDTDADEDSPLMRFSVDPVAYILGHDEEGPAAPTDDRDKGSNEEVNYEAQPDFGDGSPDGLGAVGTVERNGRSIQVEYLHKNGLIRCGRWWEFVPYNDAPPNPITDDFTRAVAEKREVLEGIFDIDPDPAMSARDRNARHRDAKAALKELKDVYRNHFGKDERGRNAISLFLYGGQRYRVGDDYRFFTAHSVGVQKSWSRYERNVYGPVDTDPTVWKESILYTGDGYLDNDTNTERFLKFFRGRIERVAAFQVMHHGSSKNWYEGLADRIAPLWSIFSSDPDHQYGHPDADVLRDFWKYGPMQADPEHGVVVELVLR